MPPRTGQVVAGRPWGTIGREREGGEGGRGVVTRAGGWAQGEGSSDGGGASPAGGASVGWKERRRGSPRSGKANSGGTEGQGPFSTSTPAGGNVASEGQAGDKLS